jgi:hypothetical protein
MALIPYPNIPKLPGVPGLNRQNGAYAAAALTIVGELLPLNFFGPKWGIVDSAGSAVITPDSFIDFEYRGERKIPNYPIEKGGFQSYNKVALPFDARFTVSCSGNKKMTKQQFLAAIDKLLIGLTLVSVVTPEITFNNCNLIHADYRREARQNATMIVAQLWFQEVRASQTTAIPTAAPSGAAPTPLGQLAPVPSTGIFGSINLNSIGRIF